MATLSIPSGGGSGSGSTSAGDGGASGRDKKEGDRKRSSGKPKNESSRTYFKITATFQCNRDECGKAWKSAHVWDDEMHCEFCDTRARLVDAKDERMLISTFRCHGQDCTNVWQSIHDAKEETQACDCGIDVKADGDPQQRFGRHSWYECRNKKCSGGGQDKGTKWEDFTLEPPKSQRCSKCFSSASISKLNVEVRPFFKPRPRPPAGSGGGAVADDNRPTHDPKLCDMCQDIIRQKKGESCRRFRKVVCKFEKNSEGVVEEKIVEAA